MFPFDIGFASPLPPSSRVWDGWCWSNECYRETSYAGKVELRQKWRFRIVLLLNCSAVVSLHYHTLPYTTSGVSNIQCSHGLQSHCIQPTKLPEGHWKWRCAARGHGLLQNLGAQSLVIGGRRVSKAWCSPSLPPAPSPVTNTTAPGACCCPNMKQVIVAVAPLLAWGMGHVVGAAAIAAAAARATLCPSLDPDYKNPHGTGTDFDFCWWVLGDVTLPPHKKWHFILN